MGILPVIAESAEELTAIFKDLHAHPEIGFQEVRTAGVVAETLRSYGVDEVHTGIGKTGVVGLIKGRGDGGRRIGLRADMDALPIHEQTNLPYSSKTPGVMHACGHDGHTTMLLGAAKYLAETRNFAGSVALIFQPAEEGPGGAALMVEDGIMDRYSIEEVYALHTLPGEDAGSFHTCPGPIMAAVDTFHIDITGQGGHAAFPHETRDPVVAAVGIVQAIQTIVSRNHYALDEVVVSVTQIHTGSAENIVPETAYINGTIRSFSKDVQRMVWTRLEEIVAGQAASFGVAAELRIEEGYPATINDADAVNRAAEIAREVAGETAVITTRNKEMGAEDFACMLEKRPGAYLFLGQGEGPGLHAAGFDFNDEVAPVGASFFARLIEHRLPLG
jgi:amidohydrolase